MAVRTRQSNCYPVEHYAAWTQDKPKHAALFLLGGFRRKPNASRYPRGSNLHRGCSPHWRCPGASNTTASTVFQAWAALRTCPGRVSDRQDAAHRRVGANPIPPGNRPTSGAAFEAPAHPPLGPRATDAIASSGLSLGERHSSIPGLSTVTSTISV
jgi:hypothetical protein